MLSRRAKLLALNILQIDGEHSIKKETTQPEALLKLAGVSVPWRVTGQSISLLPEAHAPVQRFPAETDMNLPSREECESWDSAQVAFFMCQNKMQECVPIVKKLRINGQRFLNISDSDISKFSLIHQPQLQKIVQDIKKKDGSLLNKLRRMKNKPSPNVPARDYREDDRGSDDHLSESDNDNDLYEDPRDDSYEPPPSHRSYTATPPASFPSGQYLDSCRNSPSRPPRKPLCPGKASKQLPPEPTHAGNEEEDYVSPNGSNDDDNYVEPEENQPANPMKQSRGRTGMERSVLHTPLLEPPRSPDFYEVPDNGESLLSSPASRLYPTSATQILSLPPKPSPRQNLRTSPLTVQEPTEEDEYEVCDLADGYGDKTAEGPPPVLPKPLARERSPKPPLKPRADLKPRGFESQTLPVKQTDHKAAQHKAFSLDLKRPKIPLPQLISLKPAEISFPLDNGSTDEDEHTDVFRKPWYAGACDRRTADEVLLRTNIDGAFMVRRSSGHDAQQPYTLVVFYNDRVYNIPVRFMANTQQYALGREKKGEEHFSSVSHIIESHQRNPLVLIDSQSNSKDTTRLRYPVKP